MCIRDRARYGERERFEADFLSEEKPSSGIFASAGGELASSSASFSRKTSPPMYSMSLPKSADLLFERIVFLRFSEGERPMIFFGSLVFEDILELLWDGFPAFGIRLFGSARAITVDILSDESQVGIFNH